MYIESEQVELKREYTRDIIKEIIAFLNTKGGHIYIGIEILEQDVICINVKEGSVKPYYIKGKGLRPEGVYVRLGSVSVPSSEAGIKQMLIAATNVSFELMPCSDQELVFSTAKKVFSENQLTFGASDYRKLNIVDENNRYTNIGMIISDQCEHAIKVAVFGEEDEFEFIDRREFKGSVFSVLKDTLQYLDLNNHLHSEIIEYQRIEKNDYNKEVIREGLQKLRQKAHTELARL